MVYRIQEEKRIDTIEMPKQLLTNAQKRVQEIDCGGQRVLRHNLPLTNTDKSTIAIEKIKEYEAEVALAMQKLTRARSEMMMPTTYPMAEARRQPSQPLRDLPEAVARGWQRAPLGNSHNRRVRKEPPTKKSSVCLSAHHQSIIHASCLSLEGPLRRGSDAARWRTVSFTPETWSI